MSDDKVVPLHGEEEELDVDLIALFDYKLFEEVTIGDGFIHGHVMSRSENPGDIQTYRVVGVRADGMPYDDWVYLNQIDVKDPPKRKP